MPQIKKILVANRAEIACRIFKTCTNMDITSVAVYSDADADSLHVKSADEAVALGGLSSLESYLDIPKIINAAKNCGADAIHPGYGFLSENPKFAQAVIDNGFIFIGPTPQTIAVMGNKARAKKIMQDCGIPVIPGYHGDNQSTDHLVDQITKIGLPCMIKAASGGGGKGLKRVCDGDDLVLAIESARREGQSSFADGTLIIEKLIESPRHIEIQIFADSTQDTIHLFERECTLQRRHQKVIEESPSIFLTEELRHKMGEAAVRAARAVKYTGAGTVEFIVDPLKNFYFLEMNTRLQVEHPVTEMITGLDLVKMQIETAQGHPLLLSQNQVQKTGHAIEARIYAENPFNNFLPACGKIVHMSLPGFKGIRYDMGVQTGSEISIHYDPMLGKIIAHAKNRDQCIQLLSTALNQTAILGTATNLDFLNRLITHPEHIRGTFDTGFIEQNLNVLLQEQPKTAHEYITIAAAVLYLSEFKSPLIANNKLPVFAELAGFRITDTQTIPVILCKGQDQIRLCYRVLDPQNKTYEYILNNATYTAKVNLTEKNKLYLNINNDNLEFVYAWMNETLYFKTPGKECVFTSKAKHQTLNNSYAKDTLTAPLPGKVLKIMVKPGQRVSFGQTLVIVEAMKMEHPIKAGLDGIVDTVCFRENDTVNLGEVLLNLKPL